MRHRCHKPRAKELCQDFASDRGGKQGCGQASPNEEGDRGPGTPVGRDRAPHASELTAPSSAGPVGAGCMHDSVTTKGIHKPNDLEVVNFFIHTWGATWLRRHLAPLSGHDSVELMWIEPALKL